MKILITGATGFVGKHVATRLLADGHNVTCLVRNDGSEAARRLQKIGAGLSRGDILDTESLAAAAAGVDAVVHLVGIIFQRRGASFDDIHRQGTLNTVTAASKAGAKRFVHMSALGTGPGAASAYHHTKWQGEEVVRLSGIPYTIFRPSVIYGPGGEFINMLVRQVRMLPVIPVIGNGRYRMQPVWVEDVAACFSQALQKPETVNRVYEIGGPQPLSYNEMIDVICRVMGRRRLKAHIPVPLVRPVAWLCERLMSKPLLTTDQLTMLLKDNICDIDGMRQDLGVEPVEFTVGLESLLK